jgi:pimeloyl-ACP methyl ester carboxylesterase
MRYGLQKTGNDDQRGRRPSAVRGLHNHNLEHAYVTANDVTLHTVRAGPPGGPLVLLLHGFPEFWFGWRSQIPALARAGYRLWAPDQRGYNLSEKPRHVAAYNLNQLAADVRALIKATGRKKVHLVGHDWGAAVAWRVATKWPDLLHRLVILNVPHPAVMRRHLRHSWKQRLRSWYAAFFQIPWLPERLARLNEWRALSAAVRRSGRAATFSRAELEAYRRAWARPGAMTAMLNWYRAAARTGLHGAPSRPVTTPTLIIWGAQDVFLNREMASESLEMCENGRLILIEEATHWVQHDTPQRVNELMLNFLATA